MLCCSGERYRAIMALLFLFVVKVSIYLNRRVFEMCFPNDRSNAVLLFADLLYLCICGIISGVCVSSLFVPHRSFFTCLGGLVRRDCGIFTFHLCFFPW